MPDDPDFGTMRLDIGKGVPETPKKKEPPRPVLKPGVKPQAPPPAGAKPAAPAPPAAKPPAAPAPPTTTLTKPAGEIAKLFPLTEEGKKVLVDGMTVKVFIEALVKEKLFIDAIRVLGHALPKREGVWWACLCSRAVLGADPAGPAGEALKIAQKWLQEPTEENRRPAMKAAEAAELGTPAGCAALATFWSGGSLGPPDVPVIPPLEHLTGHGASCAALLAAVFKDPGKAEERYVQFLNEGIKVAEGANLWPGAPAPAPPKK